MPLLNKKILLRVTESERQRIQADAKSRHLSVNDHLRSVALGLPTEQQLATEERLNKLERRVTKLEGLGRPA